MRTALKPSTIFGVIGQVLVESDAGVALEAWVRQMMIGGLGFGWSDGVRFAATVVAGVGGLSSATVCRRLVVSFPVFVIVSTHEPNSSSFLLYTLAAPA